MIAGPFGASVMYPCPDLRARITPSLLNSSQYSTVVGVPRRKGSRDVYAGGLVVVTATDRSDAPPLLEELVVARQ